MFIRKLFYIQREIEIIIEIFLCQLTIFTRMFVKEASVNKYILKVLLSKSPIFSNNWKRVLLPSVICLEAEDIHVLRFGTVF